MSIDDLKDRMVESEYGTQSWENLPDRKEDLNGINPTTTILFSVFPVLASFGLFKLSAFLTDTFALDYIDSSIYPVQRLAIVARNLVVGLSTLATGFTGVIGVGLFVLGCRVAYGVLTGELDPDKDNVSGNVK